MKKRGNKTRSPIDTSLYEKRLIENGTRLIAGVDEVGRGSLAGPVLAAAVILAHPCNIDGITDSKKLSKNERERLAEEISKVAVSIGFGIVDHSSIDRINILNAALNAMSEAVLNLATVPEFVLVDGNYTLPIDIPQLAIPHGDSLSISIAAASILAKVKRDKMMEELELEYPQFSFSSHKGYGTKQHLAEIAKYGPSKIHRMTFRGVCK